MVLMRSEADRYTCAVQNHLYPIHVLLFLPSAKSLLDTVQGLKYPSAGKSCVTIG